MHWRPRRTSRRSAAAGDACRPRHTDQHRNADATGAQSIQPGQHGIGIEGELGDDQGAMPRASMAWHFPSSACQRSSLLITGCPSGCPPIATTLMPHRSRSPASMIEMLSANGPAGVARSPAITRHCSTPASLAARSRNRPSTAREPIRRADRCGIGSKPSARTVRAAARRASSSSLASQGMEMIVPRGMRSARRARAWPSR